MNFNRDWSDAQGVEEQRNVGFIIENGRSVPTVFSDLCVSLSFAEDCLQLLPRTKTISDSMINGGSLISLKMTQ